MGIGAPQHPSPDAEPSSCWLSLWLPPEKSRGQEVDDGGGCAGLVLIEARSGLAMHICTGLQILRGCRERQKCLRRVAPCLVARSCDAREEPPGIRPSGLPQ